MKTIDEISIVVVDDHPLFRKGIVDILSYEPGIRIVGETDNGKDAVSIIRNLQPTIALVDINLPAFNGLQVTHQVKQENISTRIMLLTAYDDHDQIVHAAWAGASAYCSKDIEPVQLSLAIREVAAGKYVIRDKVFIPSEFFTWLDNQMDKARHSYSEPGSPFHPLSSREMEVLSCVVEGKSNKEIAASLGISHQTVKNHVTSILRKFNVEDRTQAVVYTLKHGWVTLSDHN